VINTAQVVEVFPGTVVQQQTRKVKGTFPAFEAAFVNVGSDVGIVQAGDI
jgi:hypothetical protein